MSSWSLMCRHVYNNFAGLVIKGYHGCKFCGPSLKDRWFNHLRNLVYDFSRVFLLLEHPYKRATSAFNGKIERTQRPAITTPVEWLRAYERENEKEFAKMFDSNGEPTLVWFDHQRIQKLKPSTNPFFTIWKRHNYGSHCTKRRGGNATMIGNNSNGWMVEVRLILII